MAPQRSSLIHQLLGEQSLHSQGFLAWWYRLTSPREVENPTLVQRDLLRRSKILSALALFLGLTLIFVTILGIIGPNKQILFTAILIYLTLIVCLFLNRIGGVHIAGAILVVAICGGMYLTLVSTALFGGGLTPNDKDILYLLFFGELIAAALLPPATVFLVAGFNVSLSLFLLNYAPRTPAFVVMLNTSGPSIILRIIEVHLFVCLVCWIVANWTQISVKLANRATEYARLQEALRRMDQQKLIEQRQLQADIETILQCQMLVANGNVQARVPQLSSPALHPVSGALNRLLTRYQKVLQEAQRVEIYSVVINRLAQDDAHVAEKARHYWQQASQTLSSPSSRDLSRS
jgi:hypothetical protein